MSATRRSTLGERAFAVAGPWTWTSSETPFVTFHRWPLSNVHSSLSFFSAVFLLSFVWYHCDCTAPLKWLCVIIPPLLVVMWSETVGLRTRLVWDQKIGLGNARCSLGLGLGLASLVLYCERQSCHARHHNDLEGHGNYSSTIYSFSLLCLKHHYRGDRQWRSLT